MAGSPPTHPRHEISIAAWLAFVLLYVFYGRSPSGYVCLIMEVLEEWFRMEAASSGNYLHRLIL